MSNDNQDYADDFRSGEVMLDDFEGWSDEHKRDFEENTHNGKIGSTLLFENERVRVWNIELQPGERLGAHRHVLEYFWTAVTPGRFIQRSYDGVTYESDYDAGLTHYYKVGDGEYGLHDLENGGDEVMVFTTVEFKDVSPNDPIELDDEPVYSEVQGH